MGDVINIKPNLSVSEGLRNIADMFDRGEFGDANSFDCTVVIGTSIFHLGCFNDEDAAANTLFDLTLGIQLLMKPVVDEAQD